MLTTVSRETNDSEGERRKKVGHYVLGPRLGEGSYAKVRLGTHIISREKVAVKIVSKRVIIQREAARRNFRREALLLQHVSHPNIVRLYEAMETPNSYYLVFELADNGNLLQYVTARETLAEGEARHLTRQIVSAVDHLHRSGIVHRDLKLENFLLNASLEIKLVDFGLSALCQREGGLTTQCGSPVYAAPEIFGSRRYGPPVDMWSVGVCLYAMVVGRLPFLPDPPTNLAQLHALILRGATIPTFLSQGLQHLLSGLLEVQESKRMSASDAWHQSWITCNGSQPIMRYPPVSKAPPPCVDTNVVRYMTTMFRFSESDVIHSVTERKLNASSATYHMLRRHMLQKKMSSQSGESLNGCGELDTEEGCGGNSELQSVENNSQITRCSHRTGSECSAGDTKEVQHKNSGKADPSNYKQCILYLKEARQNMFLNGRSMSHLQRDAVVGAVAASLGHDHHNSYTNSHKLPLLYHHKPLHGSSHHTPAHSSVGQLPPSSTLLPHPHGGDVTSHLFQPAQLQDVRLNVLGKPALKSQGYGGRHGDMSDSVPLRSSTNVGALVYHGANQPPPPPPNTAHGQRVHYPRAFSEPTARGRAGTPSSLKDPFGRDTWRTVFQQEVRVAGENEARQERSPGVSFVAPLSSTKTLTNRQEAGGASKKQNYFLVRRLAADLNRKRHNGTIPAVRRNPIPALPETNRHKPDNHNHHTNDATNNYDDDSDGATRPSTAGGPFQDKDSFLTPVIRVTITSTVKD